MAQSVCVVRATLSATNGGTTDFTKEGFGTPSAAIIIAGEANTTSNPAVNARLSIGFWEWDSGTDVSSAIFSQDGLTTMNAHRGALTGTGVLMTSSPGVAARYGISPLSDGIRITMEEDNTSLFRYCTVIMFSGISAKIGTIDIGAIAQDAAQESSSLGFAPSLVLFATTGITESASAQHAALSFGFASATGQRMIAFGSQYGVGNEVANILFQDNRCAALVTADIMNWAAEVTTFGSDTFHLTKRDADLGGSPLYFLALGGASISFDIGTLTTRTTNGTDQISTTINPDALILALSTATGTTLETDADANGFMIGLADDNGQYAHNISVQDAIAAANSNSAASVDEAIDLDTSVGNARTDMVNATVVFNTTNFEITYSLANSTARKGWWIALAGQALTYTQEGYRWRYDDGDEDGATFSTYQDSPGSASRGATKRLRVLVNVAGNPGSPNAKQFELQYRKAGSPTDTWKTVS